MSLDGIDGDDVDDDCDDAQIQSDDKIACHPIGQSIAST